MEDKVSAPSFREPNEHFDIFEGNADVQEIYRFRDEQLARMMDERQEKEWALVERIKTFSPQLAHEVAEAFGLE